MQAMAWELDLEFWIEEKVKIWRGWERSKFTRERER
jgi:hypothetical protein